jgi:hypothetical protein
MLTMIFVGILIAAVLGALSAWGHGRNRGNLSGGLRLVAVVCSRTASDRFRGESRSNKFGPLADRDAHRELIEVTSA